MVSAMMFLHGSGKQKWRPVSFIFVAGVKKLPKNGHWEDFEETGRNSFSNCTSTINRAALTG
jgi:hypothetical protein